MGKNIVKHIAVIGAGTIGSRHLQGLAKLDFPVALSVIDPSGAALKLAAERYSELPENENIKRIEYFTSVDPLAEKLDLCIIATTADIRAAVTEKLLEGKDVGNILFEKVVFQSPDDFQRIGKLINKLGVKAWVNYVMRLYPFYQELVEAVKPGEKITYIVSGGQWGLACNAIHYIDLLAYFTGGFEYELDISGLDRTIVPSKRKNYYEVTGTLLARFKNGSEAILHSREGSQAPYIINILSDSRELLIDEEWGTMQIARKETGWRREEIKIRVPYQSEATTLIAREILTSGQSVLATYEEAYKEHIPYLTELARHFREVGGKQDKPCPIT